jgi:hypothetical protein
MNNNTYPRELETKEQCMARFQIGKHVFKQLVEDGVIPIIELGYKTKRVPVKEATRRMLALSNRGCEEGGESTNV